MELRCDNTAAIVLATGEGSWRTKSAANKVHAVKEKVENGSLKVTYVGTRDQCADSLTKFLKGGQEQIRAIEHLSLIDLEKWLPRRMELVTKARGIKLSGCSGISGFAPGVFRISVSDRPFREFSGGSGPCLLDCGEKRLCHRKTTSCPFSVAILARRNKPFDCEKSHLGVWRNAAMVIVAKAGEEEKWTARTYDEILENMTCRRSSRTCRKLPQRR